METSGKRLTAILLTVFLLIPIVTVIGLTKMEEVERPAVQCAYHSTVLTCVADR